MVNTLIADQDEFDSYIRSLKDTDRCKFMTGMDLDLCTFDKFECQFRGEETFSMRSGRLKECRRTRVMKLKKALGSRNSHQ
jgi:hypothetical protein